ncbi:MAG: imidazole glycerol phosphate synthase subunit HisH [Alphaproteobacteria bacterium]|jgi:glutamine amidotransferase
MTVAIIDYGSGNLRSAAKAFERASDGVDVLVTNQASDLDNASHIVLPGVGAFGDCASGLDSVLGMMAALKSNVIDKGKPFLGICVGMQLMADRGLEHGTHEGFGWIGGDVVAIERDKDLKVPHMGWNELEFETPHPLLDGITPGSHAYFVHSYQLVPKTPSEILATVDYGGAITAMVGRDNMVGTQFHPEKSQALGLQFIANFFKWTP